jgi:predicted RNA binding protein YcfA (HicA-like mRNA interferase family)
LSRWTPCKRIEFIRRLRKLGFEGPFSGGRHQFLVRSGRRLTIPSNYEYSIPQLKMMIEQVEMIIEREIISDEWDSLG